MGGLSTVPQAINRGKQLRDSQNTDIERLSDHELVSLSPHLWYIRQEVSQEVAKVLRAELIRRKRQYDAQGEEYKTPFALSSFTDPLVRQLIFINTNSFATVDGCTGGCKWCGSDAYKTGPKNIEPIPLQQKFHFTREWWTIMQSLYRDPEKLRSLFQSIMYFGSTDSYDDPDIVPLMTTIYGEFGTVPGLSTVVPPSGEDNFKLLAGWALKHKALKYLRNMISNPRAITQIKDAMDGMHLHTFSEALNFQKKVKYADELKRRVRIVRIYLDHGASVQNIESMLTNARSSNPIAKLQTDDLLSFFSFRPLSYYLEHQESLGKIETTLNEIPNHGQLPQPLQRIGAFLHEINIYLQALGLETLEQRYDATDTQSIISSLNESCCKFEADRDGGKWGPDIGEHRVSVVNHRETVVDDLRDRTLFSYHPRDIKRSMSTIRPAGYTFFKLPPEEQEALFDPYGGIFCSNGIEITPFGVFNAVAGKMTNTYPQGRIIIQFKGFKNKNSLFNPGMKLKKALESVIVLKERFYVEGGGRTKEASTPSEILITDGSQLRKLSFNRDTYEITGDEVILEHISSIENLRPYLH